MTETTWVRSAYLYLMCAASLALVGLGAVAFVVGTVHAIAPDLGHRDTLDRVGIGLSNVGTDVLELFSEGELESIREYCEDLTDDEEEVDECIEEEQSFSGSGDELGSIKDGIGSIESELRGQIRSSSVDRMIRGALMVLAGVILFRIHGKRTELFADGLGLRARKAAKTVTAPTEVSPAAATPVVPDAAPADAFAPPPPPPVPDAAAKRTTARKRPPKT